MKKIFLFNTLILTPLFLFSQNNIQQNIIKTSGEGKSNIIELEGAFPVKELKKEYNYEKEILLNYHLLRQKISFNTIDGEQRLFVVAKKEEPKNDISSKSEITLVSIKGYCIVEETIDIGKQPMAANLNCNTNIGPIKFFGNYVPHNSLETLFVTGLHIEKNNKKYKIENAKILNENRTSYNIATYVNNRKLEKVALEAAGNTALAVKEGANDYLDQLEASKVSQEASGANAVSNGLNTVVNQPVVTTNTEKPDAEDYIVKGAIDIVTGTLKAVTDIYKSDLPYLYQIVDGSKLYIDLYVNPNEMVLDNTTENNINKTNYNKKN